MHQLRAVLGKYGTPQSPFYNQGTTLSTMKFALTSGAGGGAWQFNSAFWPSASCRTHNPPLIASLVHTSSAIPGMIIGLLKPHCFLHSGRKKEDSCGLGTLRCEFVMLKERKVVN